MALIGEMQYLKIGGNTYSIPSSQDKSTVIDWNENDSTSASYIQNRPFYAELNIEDVLFEQDVDLANSYNGIYWNNVSFVFSEPIPVGTDVSLTIDDFSLDTAVEEYYIGIQNPGDSAGAASKHVGLTLSGTSSMASGITIATAAADMFTQGVHHFKLTRKINIYHKLDNQFVDVGVEPGTGTSSVQQKSGGSINASGPYSAAFGKTSIASGDSAFSTGTSTASGICSHAEGGGTEAYGDYAHTEGAQTRATGMFSHAEGSFTIANHRSQHVFGQFNIADSSTASAAVVGNYVEIVGNGTGTSARANARTLDWSGNEWLAGKLTLGTAGSESMDVATIGQLPTTTSQLTNDSGYITSYTETDPVFSASAAAGITATDISNWNAKVSDDKTWNGITLNKISNQPSGNIVIPYIDSVNNKANYIVATPNGGSANILPKYDTNGYLKSTTPSANDNSTKVATTAYVDSAIISYTAGTGIDITNGVISINLSNAEGGTY